MSYPEPRYGGDSGEVSASFRSGISAPDLTYPSGNTVDYLATGGLTNGQFGLYRWNMSAHQGGADPHFHRTISESFFVLSVAVRARRAAGGLFRGTLVEIAQGKDLSERERTEFFLRHDNHWL